MFLGVEFLEKLAVLTPAPRGNLCRYHGVFAPGAKWRGSVVRDRAPADRNAESCARISPASPGKANSYDCSDATVPILEVAQGDPVGLRERRLTGSELLQRDSRKMFCAARNAGEELRSSPRSPSPRWWKPSSSASGTPPERHPSPQRGRPPSTCRTRARLLEGSLCSKPSDPARSVGVSGDFSCLDRPDCRLHFDSVRRMDPHLGSMAAMRASIGSDRKTYYPIRTRFFDPGVCSRFCRAVSSGDFGLVAPREQQRSGYEWLGLVIQFEGNLIVSRFVGICALHRFVGTILPSGPYEAIASFGSSKGHSLSVGPPGCGPWASAHTDAHLRVHALRELRTLFAIACLNDCLLVDSSDRAAA